MKIRTGTIFGFRKMFRHASQLSPQSIICVTKYIEFQKLFYFCKFQTYPLFPLNYWLQFVIALVFSIYLYLTKIRIWLTHLQWNEPRPNGSSTNAPNLFAEILVSCFSPAFLLPSVPPCNISIPTNVDIYVKYFVHILIHSIFTFRPEWRANS